MQSKQDVLGHCRTVISMKWTIESNARMIGTQDTATKWSFWSFPKVLLKRFVTEWPDGNKGAKTGQVAFHQSVFREEDIMCSS
jgi:hypothetical protein